MNFPRIWLNYKWCSIIHIFVPYVLLKALVDHDQSTVTTRSRWHRMLGGIRARGENRKEMWVCSSSVHSRTGIDVNSWQRRLKENFVCDSYGECSRKSDHPPVYKWLWVKKLCRAESNLHRCFHVWYMMGAEKHPSIYDSHIRLVLTASETPEHSLLLREE